MNFFINSIIALPPFPVHLLATSLTEEDSLVVFDSQKPELRRCGFLGCWPGITSIITKEKA
jgi:hypothetical protein